MNTIAQLLTPSGIALDVDADSKARLFEQAGALFERSAGLPRTVVSAERGDLSSQAGRGKSHHVSIFTYSKSPGLLSMPTLGGEIHGA